MVMKERINLRQKKLLKSQQLSTKDHARNIIKRGCGVTKILIWCILCDADEVSKRV